MNKADLVIIVGSEDLRRKHYAALKAVPHSIPISPLPEGIPVQLEIMAPSIVTLNREGQVTAYDTL
jgi:hypothetical protein